MKSNLIALIITVFAFAHIQAVQAEVAQGPQDPAAQTSPSGAKRFNMSDRLLDLAIGESSTALDESVQEHVAVSWSDLKPALKSLETPFESLPDPLLNAMRTQVRWRTSSTSERTDPDLINEYKAANGVLSANDVDVEKLILERRKIIAQNNSVGRGPNLEKLGTTIRIPGYIVPLTIDGGVVTEFLFVPVAGSCVHTPSPPPNQIIHVDYPTGVEFKSIFDAFWIEGELSEERKISDVTFYDGATNVESIYKLNAHIVEAFTY
ncbi:MULTISPECIES: DUF3299 domain-containing protein [unclassified Ruegeria]|uniref:DUF3299 domain-containing protein n=1 Tax=unclassified Ruegeria TaxID=2625375 RepID=UPI001490BED5|nr:MULTISPECIES: DUF3299 domain-containing protein [unclassified Ruegeria]NOD37082.1 DUF3299 domain-containing protein [Ruegeria sp. HKCCD7296]NOE44244.1 DUF3299 domain-containing protein [Ruegeria sp. HKCCD7319]